MHRSITEAESDTRTVNCTTKSSNPVELDQLGRVEIGADSERFEHAAELHADRLSAANDARVPLQHGICRDLSRDLKEDRRHGLEDLQDGARQGRRRTRQARLATPVTSRHRALGRSVHDAPLQRGLESTAWRFRAGFR